MRRRFLLPLLFLTACQSNPVPRTVQTFNQSPPAPQNTLIDDSELAGGFQPQTISRLQQEAIQQRPDQMLFRTRALRPVQPMARQGLVASGRLMYNDRNGKLQIAALASATLYQGERKINTVLTDAEGRWQMAVPAAGKYNVRYSLENPRWKIGKYTWQGPEADVTQAIDFGETALVSGTANGEAAWIHEVFLKSLALFEREQVPLDWWKRQISVNWPGSGNYYTNYSVTLTGAEQWDVNGHEVGHAIYHQALNARSEGGQHKIDECYSPTLALSEGFATFFSGAVHLSKDDPDAHFDKYLVPRRAPIRIENVPDDVCKGARNEWRVASAFWEIYDQHADGADQMSLGLKEIFGILGRRDQSAISSTLDAYKLLQKALPAEQQSALQAAFAQNTMEVQ